LQVEEVVDTGPRRADAPQHATDIRHAESFRVVGEQLRPVIHLPDQAGVIERFLEGRVATLHIDTAHRFGRGNGAEAVDVEVGELMPHTGMQGQLVERADLGLEERRIVAEHRFRHPFPISENQLLAGGVLQHIESAGEHQAVVEHAIAADRQLAAELVRLVLRLIEQRSRRRDAGVLEGGVGAATEAAAESLGIELQAQFVAIQIGMFVRQAGREYPVR